MKILFILIVFLFIPIAGHAITIHVPGDYPTIQEAINAASPGDMVLVSPGTYFENIDFIGKAITVKSSNGPDVTVIDGNKKSSVVTFSSGEWQNSVLDGFSITNGLGTTGYFVSMGGGIYCSDSSPTIKNNNIHHNKVEYSGSVGFGGGIYCNKSSPIIMNNTIAKNFVGDTAGCGGGVYCFEGSVTMTGNIISGNWIWKNGNGGGISSNCAFNYLANNIIFNNSAGSMGGHGGGISIAGDSIIVNNTICNNSAPNGSGGGIDSDSFSPVEIMNSIVWNNDALVGDQINGTPTVNYCDVQDGYPGTGNIDQEPLFLDPGNGDYHLTWTSPCINRGTNVDAPVEDFEGDARPFMGTVDMGADEFTGSHPLEVDTFAMSVSGMDALNLTLTGESMNGGRMYIILGSITGNAPGLALPGGMAVLPINWDAFTSFVFNHMNTPLLTNFLGTLDASGSGWALFDPQGALAGLVGFTMSFSYALNNPWDFASNPINVLIVP